VLIDWFTVGAQVVNFLILVWLLKRYLYRPVLAAIDARRQKIAAKIADAAAQETRAQAAGEALRLRSEAFDRDREGLLRKSAEAAAAELQGLRESARQDSQLLRAKLTQTLASERAELGRQLSTRTQAEVFAMARKALSDLAGAGLEERIIDVFIARLAAADFVNRAAGNTGEVRVALVRSAFAPSATARTRIEAAVQVHLGATATVRFETAPELICGIELTSDGIKLAWCVSNYLSSLAQDVAALATTALTAAPLTAPLPGLQEAEHAH
jgi:F-type H+-transporting ATPase subunit b